MGQERLVPHRVNLCAVSAESREVLGRGVEAGEEMIRPLPVVELRQHSLVRVEDPLLGRDQASSSA